MDRTFHPSRSPARTQRKAEGVITFGSYGETWTVAAASICVTLDRQRSGLGEEVEVEEVEDQVFSPVSASSRLDTCSLRLNLCC